jgi:hypothetical protein
MTTAVNIVGLQEQVMYVALSSFGGIHQKVVTETAKSPVSLCHRLPKATTSKGLHALRL